MVLAAALMAWVSRRHHRCWTLALACCIAGHCWVCNCVALHLGLRLDRTRHTSVDGTSAKTCCGVLLSLRAESDVSRLLCWLGGTLDRLWTREPGGDPGGSA